MRVSSLSLIVVCALPLFTYAANDIMNSSNNSGLTEEQKKQHNKNETMTIVATGNSRDSFSAPMMVTVIKGDTPTSHSAFSAIDMLRAIPGITLSGSSRTNGQEISMRGYDSKGVLTLVDGVRQGIETVHTSSIFLDPSMIKQAEIVRGPSALLYGGSALGGVVSYQTVDAADLLLPDQNVGYRVFGLGATGNHSLGMGGSVFGKTANLDGLITFSTRDIGNINQGKHFSAPNNESINNVMTKGTWAIDDNQSLSANLRYYNNRSREPENPQQSEITAENKMTKRSTLQRDAQLNYRLNPQDLAWLDATTALYYSDLNIHDLVLKEGEKGYEQITRGVKLENRSRFFTHSPASHLLTYGTEAYQQKQNPSGLAKSFPAAKINVNSVWAQDEITLRDLPVSFLLGTRFDRYRAENKKNPDVSAEKWSSRGAITITPTDWLMMFGSYAQAFRAPKMGEIYNEGKHFSKDTPHGVITNFWQPNPNLKPETNETQEYGFGLQFDNVLANNDAWQFKASYFDTQAKDYIYLDVYGRGTKTKAKNIKNAKIWGWDVMMNYQTDWFSWDLVYNRTRGKNQESGNYIASINPDTLTSRLDLPIARTGFSTGWVLTVAKNNHFMVTPPGIKPEIKPQAGYGVNDFYLSYKGQGHFQGMTTTAVLANAFDKQYASPQGIPQDGRSAKLFISYQW